MAPVHVERRLAAILVADVGGYSKLVGADEEGTIARLRAMRNELIGSSIAKHIRFTQGDYDVRRSHPEFYQRSHRIPD